MTDFRDREAGIAARKPDTESGGIENTAARTTSVEPAGPEIAAARVRLGIILPNGRIAGRTDQIVHVVPLLPATAEPGPLRAYCGLVIEPGKADFVTLLSGPPCTRCVLLALEKRPLRRSQQP